MQFGKSAGNFGGSAFRRSFGHDSACGLPKLVALLPNSTQIVHNWSEKGVHIPHSCMYILATAVSEDRKLAASSVRHG